MIDIWLRCHLMWCQLQTLSKMVVNVASLVFVHMLLCDSCVTASTENQFRGSPPGRSHSFPRFRVTRRGLSARCTVFWPDGSPYVGRARFPTLLQCLFRGLAWEGACKDLRLRRGTVSISSLNGHVEGFCYSDSNVQNKCLGIVHTSEYNLKIVH